MGADLATYPTWAPGRETPHRPTRHDDHELVQTNGFSYQTEAVVKAARSGVDWVEVGIEIQTREHGRSKALTWKNLRSVARALARLWWDVRVRERRRYRRRDRRLGRF